MRKLFSWLTAAVFLLAVGCEEAEPFDDSAIWDEFESVYNRIEELQSLCTKMNNDIAALQTIVSALEEGDYITSITPVTKYGVEVGYRITFSKSGSIIINHGTNGENGQDGAAGKDGEDGQDGRDGYTPQIGIKQDTDGIYYWTLDGEWLLDNEGQKVKAVGTDGKDGKDGEDGQDGAPGKDGEDGQDGAPGKDGQDGEDGKDGANGQDGISPKLKIEEDYWYISYNNGETWEVLGKAVGEDGKDGQDGAPGKDGQDGEDGKDGANGQDGVTPQLKIEDGYWYISYDEGKSWKKLDKATGEDGKDGQDGAPGQDGEDGKDGANGQDGVTPKLKVEEGYWYISYDEGKSWTKLDKATGEDGKDGQDGAPGKDGQDGEDGKDGTNGKDGITPKLKIEEGYWYISYNNGETWEVLGKAASSDGQSGSNGQDGQDGAPGKDGVTPKLKIEDDYWYISYDEGKSWTKLGKATGEDGKDGQDGAPGKDGQDGQNGKDGQDGDSIFSSVTEDENFVYFHLSDGTTITLPKGTGSSSSVPGIVQSVTFLPRYNDGMATITRYEGDGAIVAEFDFRVRPESAATAIANNYTKLLTMEAVETATRAFAFIDMPILSCTAEGGVITVKASGQNLNPSLFTGAVNYSAALLISDGTTSYQTDYVPMSAGAGSQPDDPSDDPSDNTPDTPATPEEPADPAADCVITYVTSDKKALSLPYFFENLVSNTYDTEANLGTMTFSQPVKTIPIRAFEDLDKLTEITLPKSVKQIGDHAFRECEYLKKVNLPEGITRINPYTFYKCSRLASITIPESVTEIGEHAFYICSTLKTIIIPDKVTKINQFAFNCCSGLKTIIIGKAVTSIGNDAFYSTNMYNCVVYIRAATPPTIVVNGSTPSFASSGIPYFYVPMESEAAYQAAAGWSGYSSKIYGYEFYDDEEENEDDAE